MNKLLRFFVLTMSLSLCNEAMADNDASWVHNPTAEEYYEGPLHHINPKKFALASHPSEFYEKLKTSEILEANGETVHEVLCDENEKKYVSRVVVFDTSNLWVEASESSLFISSGSFSSISNAVNSALVICLPKKPNRVFISLSDSRI